MVRLGVLLIVLLVAGRAAGDEPAHVVAAKARGERYESVDVTFSIKETVAVGAISASTILAPKGKTLPEKETGLTSSNRIVLHGSRARYENNHPLWHPEKGALLPTRLVNVSGGDIGKSLYTVGLNDPATPEGFIHRETDSRDIRSSLLVPLMFHLRGADRTRSPLLAAVLRPTGGNLQLAGRVCDEYTRSDEKVTTTRVWLDGPAGHLLRKYRRDTAGHPDEQHDVSYRQSPDGGWAPERWLRQTFAPDGKVRTSAEVEVTRFESGSAPPAELFHVEFPPRTRVYDARTDKFYVVQPDGLMREISLITGQDVGSVTDQTGRGWLDRNRAAVGWVVVGLVIVLAVWLFRRYRRGAAASPV